MGRPPRPPARPLTALARASTAAFGRVVGDAAPGRPTRLDSHPGGVRLGQTPGGNGCTAYSAGDRRTRLGRSAAVGSVETPAARPSPPSGTRLSAHHVTHDSSSTTSEDCCAKTRALRSKTLRKLISASPWTFRRSWSAGRRNARAVELTGSGAAVGWWSKIPHPPWPSKGSQAEPWTIPTRKKASGRTPSRGGGSDDFFE